MCTHVFDVNASFGTQPTKKTAKCPHGRVCTISRRRDGWMERVGSYFGFEIDPLLPNSLSSVR